MDPSRYTFNWRSASSAGGYVVGEDAILGRGIALATYWNPAACSVTAAIKYNLNAQVRDSDAVC